MENIELQLASEQLLTDESPLSPEKEFNYRAVITGLTNKATALEEENADLKQQLANLKKLVTDRKVKRPR